MASPVPPSVQTTLILRLRGGDVRVDDVDKRRCCVAVALEEADYLEAREVIYSQHFVPGARKKGL